MWCLTYAGQRLETSSRCPESFTVLAPQHLQDACVRSGGTNWQGKQNFRLVRVCSRYMIAGGHEFVFQDVHGNYQKTCPAEMLVPRYQAEEVEWGMYLLERWHPPQWFYDNGFAGLPDDVEYNAAGSAIRRVEPIWPEGGYEACWWDANQLFVFRRDVSADSGPLNLCWAIRSVLRAEEIKKSLVLDALKQSKERERNKGVEEAADVFKEKGRSDLFLEPAVSYAGIDKEDLCQNNASSVLVPASS